MAFVNKHRRHHETDKPEEPVDLQSPIAISLTNLWCRYRSSRGNIIDALRGIDLTVLAGSRLAIVGESSSGKTSILRAIAGLISPWQGAITFPAFGGPRPRNSIAMLFQGESHFPWRTVQSNVGFRMELAKTPKHVHDATVRELIQKVGLDPDVFQRRYLHELSGGQARRVELAMALAVLPALQASTPPLLLLDEPTTGLDFLVKRDIQELIESLLDKHPATTLIVTHDVEEAVLLGDRVALVNGGVICELVDVKLPRGRVQSREHPDIRATIEKVVQALKGTRKNANA